MDKFQRTEFLRNPFKKWSSKLCVTLFISALPLVINGCPGDDDCSTESRQICLVFTVTANVDECYPICAGPATINYNDGARNNASSWDHVEPISPVVEKDICITGLKRAGTINVSWICYNSDGSLASVCASNNMPIPPESCGGPAHIELVPKITCHCY